MSEHSDALTHGRESLRTLVRDPITTLLSKSSHLTRIQLETLLADSFGGENYLKKGKRRLYRPSGRNVTRGAFNRTLIQAQNNVIRSIYTILLLGYLGLYDSPSLQPFIELSDTIQSYVQQSRQAGKEDRLVLDELNTRLLEGISSLAKRQTFTNRQ
jgi:hypothetical protein